MSHTFRNPIIPGFHPDPSICRVADDYYLVTSTFEYFPGLPIYHSRDLVHWRPLSYAMSRPSQLPLDGVRASGGLYAPTIRHHNGKYYIVCTLVDGSPDHGNFIVTAANPAGPWSEPHWLQDAPGIDPSLFFETSEDGKEIAWYCGNRIPPNGEQFPGHREIWLQRLNLDTMQLSGRKHTLWDGALHGAVHAEAPHIYKLNGQYYLIIAEGGTGHNHAVTIARSDSITGPYESNPRNPILTHRHLGKNYPITNTGHADLVQTQIGEWWMVALASRPVGGYFYNLGRETWLIPVIWEDGWPIVSPGSGRIEWEYPAPELPTHPWPARPACDTFEGDTLDHVWNFRRTPRGVFWSLSDRPGYLRLCLRPEQLTRTSNPSFIGRRLQHINFTARTAMEFKPSQYGECAGVALLQNEKFQFQCVLIRSKDGRDMMRLSRYEGGIEKIVAEHHLPTLSNRMYIKVEAKGQDLSFYYATQPENWNMLAQDVDGRILSTPVAGGFTGAYMGLYASSNGHPTASHADFAWFEYTELRI